MTDPAPWNALEGWYDRPDWQKRVGGVEPEPFDLCGYFPPRTPEDRFRRRVERVLEGVLEGAAPTVSLSRQSGGQIAEALDALVVTRHGADPAKRYDSRPGRRVRNRSTG